MKFSVIDENTFNIYVNNKYLSFSKDDESLYDALKKILINVKKKYGYDIYGFYQVDVYKIDNIAIILEFKKKEESLICKTVDLKLVHHSSNNIYLKFNDLYLIKKYKKVKYFNWSFYIRLDEIKLEDINRLIEHFEVVIDERLYDISYI